VFTRASSPKSLKLKNSGGVAGPERCDNGGVADIQPARSLRDLKAALVLRGVDISGFCEKSELIDALHHVLDQEQQNEIVCEEDALTDRVRPTV